MKVLINKKAVLEFVAKVFDEVQRLIIIGELEKAKALANMGCLVAARSVNSEVTFDEMVGPVDSFHERYTTDDDYRVSLKQAIVLI